MTEATSIPSEEVDVLYQRLSREAEASGYHLNPDREFVLALAEGLLTNQRRYGYWACPCRLAAGDQQQDLDIICPCDYRDPDLTDWGTCYCALYVSEEIRTGARQAQPIPERRPPQAERAQSRPVRVSPQFPTSKAWPVWRCRVCGYLCAREQPPAVCPICKAKRERFERFG